MRIPFETLRAMRQALGIEAWNYYHDAIKSKEFFMPDPKGMNKALTEVLDAETVFVFYDATKRKANDRYVVVRGNERLPWSAVRHLGTPVNYPVTVNRDGREIDLMKPALLVSDGDAYSVVCVDINPQLIGEHGPKQLYVCNPQMPLHVDCVTFREGENLEKQIEEEGSLHTQRKHVLNTVKPEDKTAIRPAYGRIQPVTSP